MQWVDPLGLTKNQKETCPNAASQLPPLRGNSERHIENTLSESGFKRTKVSNSAARNQTWNHADGSEVRIHPYGNESMTNRNGEITPKSGLNAHVHKQDPFKNQLNDSGSVSRDPNLTHIGIKNPSDYPNVRNRPHGSGR